MILLVECIVLIRNNYQSLKSATSYIFREIWFILTQILIQFQDK